MTNQMAKVLLSFDPETQKIKTEVNGQIIDIFSVTTALIETLFHDISDNKEEKALLAYAFGSYFTNKYPPSIQTQHAAEQAAAILFNDN